MNRAVLHTDGGARGNPGPAGIGFVITAQGELVCEGGAYIGETTNNVAEYEALIWGLENTATLGYEAIEVKCDSELLVKQLRGEYRVKQAHLKPLYARAAELVGRFADARVDHVRREHNREADRLVNDAIDMRGPVGSPACTRDADGPATLF